MSTSILSFSTQKLRHVIPMTLAALQEDGRHLNDFPLSLSQIQKPKFSKDIVVYGFSKMVYQRIYVLLDPKVLPHILVILAAQKDLRTFLTTAISTSLFIQNR
jgi:hypothetical protein